MTIYRKGALSAVALMLAGCDPLSRASLHNLSEAVHSAPALSVSQAQVDAIPYPQLKLTTPSGEGVLAMLRQRGDLQFWVASGKQVLLLRDGLVVRTVGLGVGEDLDGTSSDDTSSFRRGLQRVADGYTSKRRIDLSGYRTGVVVDSRLSRGPRQTLRILDKAFQVLRVDEQISASSIGLYATNHYWVDTVTGRVLQSEQHLTPNLVVRIVQLTGDRESAQ